jgi:N-acylneuraminate cytidylyltransferase/CMP-N,N'-diacetyllegionaminic acid synthase
LLGKPLIAWSVEQARASALFAVVAVSSDSPAILAAAEDAGAEMLIERPTALASDVSAKLPAIQHCVREAETRSGQEFETVVDLDATAPLRTLDDIRGAVALCEAGGCDNVITGCTAHRSPYFNLVEVTEDGYAHLSKPFDSPLARRQETPLCYDCNASIYVWPRAVFFAAAEVLLPRTRLYQMPEARSRDVDSELDFALVEFLMQRMVKS